MKKIFFLMLVLFAVNSVFAAEAAQTPLSPEHKKWLDVEVSAIISDYERNAFVGLKNTADRDQFIQAFWEDRDPTPGTKRNEYKEEYETRLKYVMENFNRDGGEPWRTDRGRAWLLLGKPAFRKRFPEEPGMWPVDFWHYRDVHQYGLPESFYLLFFQKNGVGTYRFYSPANDGPEAFVHSTTQLEKGPGKGQKDKQQDNIYYDYLKDVDPELADATFSLLPTEGAGNGPFSDQSIISSELVVNKVEAARNYQFDKREYVERILEGRPKVDVYVTLGPQDVKNDVYWFQAANGNFLVDYAIQYAPDKFNMGQYEDEFYTSLTVDGSIQTAKDNTIVETINNTHEIKLNKTQFDQIRYSPFQYLGRRMIVPGNYKISILIHNNLTKSLVPIVEELQVPDFDAAVKPYFSKLLFVQGTDHVVEGAKGIKPFQFGNTILQPLVDHKYAQGQDLAVFYQLFFPAASLPLSSNDLTVEYEIYQQAKSVAKTIAPLGEKFSGDLQEGSISLFDHVKLPVDAPNGSARLVARVKRGDKVLAESQPALFSFDPTKPAVPWRLVSGIPPLESSYHQYVLAQQYLRLGQNEKAAQLLEQVSAGGQTGVDAKIQLMKLELKAKAYDKVLSLAHDLEIQYPKNKDLLWLLGWAHYGLNQFDDAVRFFERGRMEEPENVQILNTLADAYQRLARYDKSLEMIDKSLQLKPDQPEMIQMKEKIKKQGT